MSFQMIDTFTRAACGGRGINRRGWDGRPGGFLSWIRAWALRDTEFGETIYAPIYTEANYYISEPSPTEPGQPRESDTVYKEQNACNGKPCFIKVMQEKNS